MWQPRWRQDGQEPDYRFSLANERTFLAWIRSALALLAGGVLLVQFATRLTPQALVVAVGGALAVAAALLSLLAYRQWRNNEIAMRHARPLPASAGIPLLAGLVFLVCAAIAAAIVRG
jgi:putative membrane protein